MTKDKIIEMAEQAGFDPHDMSSDFTCNLENIIAFAKLVAERERESCANICEEMAVKDRFTNYYKVAANAIREKGQE
jgi:hypothetical protein